MIPQWTLIGRVALAALLGAVIGIERDLNGRPAGLRTSLIIAVGACVFALLSAVGFTWAQGRQDPTRIASIVVQGIGFIGAGAVLRDRHRIIGLTTAASVWLVAAIGLACGAGMYLLAVFATVFSVGCLVFLHPLSIRLAEIGARRRGEPSPGEP